MSSMALTTIESGTSEQEVGPSLVQQNMIHEAELQTVEATRGNRIGAFISEATEHARSGMNTVSAKFSRIPTTAKAAGAVLLASLAGTGVAVAQEFEGLDRHIQDCGETWTQDTIRDQAVTKKSPRVAQFNARLVGYNEGECQFDSGEPGEGTFRDAGENRMKVANEVKNKGQSSYRRTSRWVAVGIESDTLKVRKNVTSTKACPKGANMRQSINMIFDPHAPGLPDVQKTYRTKSVKC